MTSNDHFILCVRLMRGARDEAIHHRLKEQNKDKQVSS